MVKRTKKEFADYNDYHDRGMEYKWDTAFALGELQDGIKDSNDLSGRNIQRLKQQPNQEIEWYLEQSLKENKILEIQLNTLDDWDRVLPPIQGNFYGLNEEGQLMIGEQLLNFADIRHVKIADFKKWTAAHDEKIIFETHEFQENTDTNALEEWLE